MKISSTHKIALIIICLTSFTVMVGARTIYGDIEPVEMFYPYILNPADGWGGASFDGWEEEKDLAIFIHIIGDNLSNEIAMKIYKKSLTALDRQVRSDGIVFWINEDFDNPVFCVTAKNIDDLDIALNSNKQFREILTGFWEIEESFEFFNEDSSDTSWQSTGYNSKVFPGIFINPDYDNPDLFLQNDKQTEFTIDMRRIAELVNNSKNRTTIKEIYNLIVANTRSDRPQGFPIFESTAQSILTTGVATGCTDFAIAFATIARIKGIPSVIVDSAEIKWIEHGASLHSVTGHFFVEVLLDGEWYLVDSTAGKMYIMYDRNNWFLPDGFIAFSKELSVLDTGATEQTHNTLQRVAFWGRDIDYINPDYALYNLRYEKLLKHFKEEFSALNLIIDKERIDFGSYRGNIETVNADPQRPIPGEQ